ncbi:MAG TPA: alpha/beta hydrolase, partial [Candidatus Tumulicola sp.]|nr:alpha/beta hydrolase [Candidatus Tumulicola sp.]
FSAVLREARTPRYMHDEALAVLPEVLNALGIGETILVGHSDGASIALLFAATHPAAVRGIVLEAPHVFVEDLSVRSIAAIKAPFESGDLRAKMERHHADAARTFYGWNDVWLSPQFRQWNVEAEVERVRAPILAIQGVDDEYGALGQLDSIAGRAAGSVDRLLLAACGHAPHRDRRTFVEEAVAAWVRATME